MTPSFRPVWPRSALVVLALACTLGPAEIQATRAQEHVFVTVVDDKGRPVQGLNVSDFVVQIDGVAQEIIRAEPATTPLSIVLLTDRLGLNPNYTPFDLRQALADFVRVVRTGSPEAKFALTTFDGPVVQLTKFTSAPGELDRALGRLSSIVTTAAIVDGVSEATKQLAAAPTERRAVLVVVSSYRLDQSNLRTDLVGEQLRMSKGSLWAVEVRADRGNFTSQAREETLDARQPDEWGHPRRRLLPQRRDQFLQALRRVACGAIRRHVRAGIGVGAQPADRRCQRFRTTRLRALMAQPVMPVVFRFRVR